MKARWSGLTALLCLWAGGASALPLNFKGYTFEAHVQRGGGGQYREYQVSGRPTLRVRPDEEYSIVVYNPLPVRAAVAVSVDGLNSIDGRRTSPGQARKWIIEPRSTVTISGWQTGGNSRRNFLFTRQDQSYAQWKEDKTGKPLTKNLGVIGVAWFWNDGELQTALHPPQPFVDEAPVAPAAAEPGNRKASSAPSARSEDRAGTGMGRKEQNLVTEVEFNPTAGMFSLRDVLKLYYEFAKDPDLPLPFTGDGDEDGRFTPEMDS